MKMTPRRWLLAAGFSATLVGCIGVSPEGAGYARSSAASDVYKRQIYKDGNHYRPFFVREHADFIDVTLQD